MMTVIYIDVFILENFIIDFLILLCTSRILKQDAKFFKIAAAAFILSVAGAIFISFKIFEKLLFLRLLIPFFAVYVSFGKCTVKSLFLKTAAFYFISFIFGGFVFLMIFLRVFKEGCGVSVLYPHAYFQPKTFFVLILCALCSACVYYISKYIKHIFAFNIPCRLKVNFKNRSYNAEAIFDSGNFLKEPSSSLPVAIAESDCIEKLFGKEGARLALSDDFAALTQNFPYTQWYTVLYNTVSGSGKMLAFKPSSTEIFIDGKCKKISCIIGITKEKLARCGKKIIINPEYVLKG